MSPQLKTAFATEMQQAKDYFRVGDVRVIPPEIHHRQK